MPPIAKTVASMPCRFSCSPTTGPTISVLMTSKAPRFCLLEHGDQRIGRFAQLARRFLAGPRDAHQHLVLRRVAVLLHHGVVAGAVRQRRHRRPHLVDRHVLLELDDDDRAAGEVDAERQHAARDRALRRRG